MRSWTHCATQPARARMSHANARTCGCMRTRTARASPLSLDLSGESLHRRGYRGAAGEAPLKENVAAGMLLRAGWPELAAGGAEFLDPLCGSGTFAIEAAMIAADIAPGLDARLLRFSRLAPARCRARGSSLRDAAGDRAQCGECSACVRVLRASIGTAEAIRNARANAQRAGLESLAATRGRAARRGRAQSVRMRARCATNPPYGVRLEDREAARDVHRELGRVLRERFRRLEGGRADGRARSRASRSASARSAPTRCGTARSNAGCCASTWSRRSFARRACRRARRRSTPRCVMHRARRCSRIA